ncbi:MAG: LytTR family DNA-binding domain-containing protein [Eubacterium sp.]|nr:LytTR family DNA-binding domain-containing protein [Eubacterium sp.]
MLTIGICDDNAPLAKRLSAAITAAAAKHNLAVRLQIFTTGDALLASQKPFDVLFMDISMPGIDGLKAAEIIRRRDSRVKIVFLTAYPEYIYRSVSLHIFDYILKPVKPSKIEALLLELADYTTREGQRRTVSLLVHKTLKTFDVEDIYYLERTRRKLRLVTRQEELSFSGTLSQAMEKLQPFDFVYCHKSIIVSLFHIKQLRGADILLDNGEILPLAQKRSASFKKQLHAYIAGSTACIL